MRIKKLILLKERKMTFNLRIAIQIYLIFLTAVLLTACGRSKKVDVSNIDVNVTIERFDKDMDAMETKPIAPQAAYMQKKYGAFYNDFMERILPLNTRDTGYFKTLREIFTAGPYSDVKHEVDSIFPNLDKQNEQLTDAFKHIKYYYPKKALPRVFSYFSGFQGAQISFGNDYYAIGLDLFLGANSKFYNASAIREVFPKYVSRRFTPEYITPKLVETMAREDMFPETVRDDKTLLSRMVYNGKILYYMDKILPDESDTLKIGYTGKQLKWCNDFKAQIWAFFLEENLLYETDYNKTQKYLGEAPFTPGLGEKNDAPPRLAIWTGWQIVKEYMDKHPDVTLQQLMTDNDAQKILNDSKYRPK
jgi:gliding motility-associated lipoprotein GldB